MREKSPYLNYDAMFDEFFDWIDYSAICQCDFIVEYLEENGIKKEYKIKSPLPKDWSYYIDGTEEYVNYMKSLIDDKGDFMEWIREIGHLGSDYIIYNDDDKEASNA